MKLIKFISFLPLVVFFVNVPASFSAEVSSPIIAMEEAKNTSTSDLEKKAIQATELFFNKNFAQLKESLAPEIRKDISNELLEKEWQEINNNAGKFKQVKSVKIVDSLENNLALVTVEFEKLTENFVIIFDENQQILGTDFATSKDVADITTDIINSLAQGKYDEARAYLHPTLKEKITPEKVKLRWESLIEENGKFQKVLDTNIKTGSSENETDLVFADLQFENQTKKVLLIFDQQKKVVNIDIFVD